MKLEKIKQVAASYGCQVVERDEGALLGVSFYLVSGKNEIFLCPKVEFSHRVTPEILQQRCSAIATKSPVNYWKA